MKPINEQQLINLEGGKFWGESCGPAFSLEEGSCIQMCTYSIFWIESNPYPVTC